MNEGSTNGEEESKDFDLGSEIGGVEAGCLKTEKVQHGVATDIKFAEDIATPIAMCKVLKRVVSIVTEGARRSLIEDIEASHPSSSRPSVKKSADVDTVGSRFALS